MSLRRISTRGGLSAFVMVVLGVFIAYQSKQYDIGSLRVMGPGFIPFYCGVLLVLLGIIYFLVSFLLGEDGGSTIFGLSKDRLRGWFFILLGMIAFVFLGDWFGFFIASFFLVLISSMGSTEFKWQSSILLAFGVAISGAFIFVYLLELQIPIFQIGF